MADPKQFRRFWPASPGPLQGKPDHLPLHLFHGALQVRARKRNGDTDDHPRGAVRPLVPRYPPFPDRDQLFLADLPFSPQEDTSLDQVLELPDVPAPIVAHQGLHRIRGEPDLALPEFRAEARQGMLRQEGNVLPPFPQRRHVNPYDVQAVVEVFPEASGRHLLLDLGRVESLAEIVLNGQNLGVLWKPRYVVDCSRAARAGANTLEVRVTNAWLNRLIGARTHPDGFSGRGPLQFRPFLAADVWSRLGDRLAPAGLIGPVRLRTVEHLRVP